jgi:ABC-type multidrug transport system ATPase subunit/ABC-type multidrug transport system permease subunit
MTAQPLRGGAIRVRGLRKRYGALDAVDGLDIDIYRGEVFALLGPNGAGKTTTVEILEGYRSRDDGTISVLGEDPAHTGRRWRSRIGIVPQLSSAGPELTVRELVRHFATFYPDPRDPDEVIDLTGLTDKSRSRIRQLSGGQQRRLDVALGIVGNPELLFLDEPTTGFDPEARRKFWELIAALSGGGTTILLTTHYLDEAETLADRVAVITAGQIRAVGAPAEIGGRATAVATVTWIDHDGPGVCVTDSPTRTVTELYERFGGEVPGLTVSRPTLEDVYLELIRDNLSPPASPASPAPPAPSTPPAPSALLPAASLPSSWRVGRARTVVELKSIIREPLSLAFGVSLPAVLLLLLGAIFRNQVAHGISVGAVFAAGLIGGGVAATSFQNLGITIAVERDERMLRRLAGTPMPRLAYFIGKTGLVLVLTVAEVVVLFALAMVVDGLRFPSTAEQWWTFTWVFVLGTIACALLGVAASSVPRSARSATPVLVLPLTVIQFISGVYVPPGLIPTPMRVLASFFPVKWICQQMRSVFLPARAVIYEPAGTWEHTRAALVLVIWIIIGLALCARTFRWRTDA